MVFPGGTAYAVRTRKWYSAKLWIDSLTDPDIVPGIFIHLNIDSIPDITIIITTNYYATHKT